jgi:hypothetical protein
VSYWLKAASAGLTQKLKNSNTDRGQNSRQTVLLFKFVANYKLHVFSYFISNFWLK